MLISPAALTGEAPRTPPVKARAGSALSRWSAHGVSLSISAVFLDSLRFKFTNAPKTQAIFGDLDAWAATFGAGGLFAPTGLFSQYAIGGAELVSSTILLGATLVPRLRFLRPLGAFLALAIMSGAMSFHLFTPLGIDVADDRGALFFTACAVWTGALALLVLGADERKEFLARLGAFFAPVAR